MNEQPWLLERDLHGPKGSQDKGQLIPRQDALWGVHVTPDLHAGNVNVCKTQA